MRGKVRAFVDAGLYAGITPAHAGKRLQVLYDSVDGEDHPRACGEKHRLL